MRRKTTQECHWSRQRKRHRMVKEAAKEIKPCKRFSGSCYVSHIFNPFDETNCKRNWLVEPFRKHQANVVLLRFTFARLAWPGFWCATDRWDREQKGPKTSNEASDRCETECASSELCAVRNEKTHKSAVARHKIPGSNGWHGENSASTKREASKTSTTPCERSRFKRNRLNPQKPLKLFLFFCCFSSVCVCSCVCVCKWFKYYSGFRRYPNDEKNKTNSQQIS